MDNNNQNKLSTRYEIHPGIGMARLGNSPTEYTIAPEIPGGLPIVCDPRTGRPELDDQGQERTSKHFKDSECRIKRQAARFKIFVYDDQHPEGRELQKGEMIYGPGSQGKLVNIEWTVYLANKKAVWYQFEQLQGEHGYAPDHPLRNPGITEENARQQLIIDPGPQTVYDQPGTGRHTRASFARGENKGYAQIFPPPLDPCSIDTLGEVLTDGDLHLLVLGGHGNSGSDEAGPGQPRIDNFANNDGWFDDVADGPVQAKLMYHDEEDHQTRYVAVEQPAWVIVGQPGYVPELLNIITLDEVVYDVAVRHFGYDTYLYGVAPFPEGRVPPDQVEQWRLQENRYNPDYYPLFFRDIWPILERPSSMQWVTTRLGPGSAPHDTGPRGNFDICQVSVPPYHGQPPEERARQQAMRNYIYQSLRGPGEENKYLFDSDPDNQLHNAPMMPLLCGDNPIDNTLPSKFLRLTDTQLFLLEQWRAGKFVNECREGFEECVPAPSNPNCKEVPPGTYDQPPKTGDALDRGVLANSLGGAFCPGGEVGWILRNPDIYQQGFRINANRSYIPGLRTSTVGTTPGVETYERPALGQKNAISDGLEPGDITKYNALPWQADFNECSNQVIDVTYEEWNVTYPEDPNHKVTNDTLWWPAHRPMQVQMIIPGPDGDPSKRSSTSVQWARGIPQTSAGDLKMVTAWKDLGFVVHLDPGVPLQPGYYEIERNDAAFGDPPSGEGCECEKDE